MNRPSTPAGRPAVASAQVADYEPGAVRDAVAGLVERLGGMARFVKPGQRVLVKPNLLAPMAPEKAVTTHPAVVDAVLALVIAAGGRPVVGDSPGVGRTETAAAACGLLPVLEKYGAPLADFTTEVVTHHPENTLGKVLTVARAVTEADVLITLPKLKNHGQMILTCAVKNQYGLIPGVLKGQYHFRFMDADRLADLLVDLNRAYRPALAVMDAVTAMEGDGPSGGDPRHVGVLAASDDVVALDLFACGLIGLDPDLVPTVRASRRQGFGPDRLEDVDVIGPAPDTLRVPGFKPVGHLHDVLRIAPLPRPVLRWLRRQWAPRPVIVPSRCVGCNRCRDGCPVTPTAIDPASSWRGRVDRHRCIRCYCCHEFCPARAIELKRSVLDRALKINRTLNRLGDLAARLVHPRRR